MGSKLIVLRGSPLEVFDLLFSSGKFTNLFYEKDTEPLPLKRDKEVEELCPKYQVTSKSFFGRTLYNPEDILAHNNGVCPGHVTKFISITNKLPKCQECVREPQKGEIINFNIEEILEKIKYTKPISVPKVDELVDKNLNEQEPTHILKGGETEGLKLMFEFLKDEDKIATFDKPKTNPVISNPCSTSMLSPYLKYGAVSVRNFYHKIDEIIKQKKKYTRPPNSLIGQLFWREFYYLNAYSRPNFNCLKNNSACKVVDWYLIDYPFDNNQEIPEEELQAEKNLKAWAEGKTGYPWIDAIMTQLRKEGWIHHYLRQSVVCFLSKGDLYINWERGQEVFEELLLDADYALNAGNWMMLSSTSIFFFSYFRISSPITYGKKLDPSGDYIRKHLPQLRKYPTEFIFEPWTAPIELQEEWGCIVGKDYPERIINHKVTSLNKKLIFKKSY